VTMEVACRLTDWTYKGVDVLKLNLSCDRRFEDPDRIRALEEEPLPDVGLFDAHKECVDGLQLRATRDIRRRSGDLDVR